MFTTGIFSCCFGEAEMLRRDERVRQGIRGAMLTHRAPTVGDTLADIATSGYDLREVECGVATARIFPAFAADMALLLKCRLGPMELTNANVLLVNAEYHRVCRELSVRYVDQAAHRQHVVNAVFYEGVYDVVGQTRNRLPRWLRLLLGHPSPVVAAAC